ncbi:tripartite tricarboxylate transporter permease [Calycomorphotria hydatis]|uniref:Tripartite tricarboxylate transporter TctA family protein n=1 Tax=Calycomorphotria hydatis TaxID=2528027 RepID=A0A517T686_9PLAN|nr:tripartite tricarboxylate transporter permease [Calycomorphotria hydatis]QDT63884.1 Tripartite tricarboxylate transporter TctA family protein [Calycomorphotria hydatis]
MSEAALAISEVFGRVDIWLIIIASACYGILVGAIPGLTATMAVALFVPLAYWLDPVAAIAAIVTMVASAIFAGDIPTVFLRIPGTPASAAYADDAAKLVQQGLAERVLCLALVCSATGGVIGSLILMFSGGQLSKVAGQFSVSEYFWLYLMGLSCAVLVSSGAKIKAVQCLLIGLLLSTIGLSASHVEPRFTFGFAPLYNGISFIPAMIGLFGLSEVFRNLSGSGEPKAVQSSVPRDSIRSMMQQAWGDTAERVKRHKLDTVRSSIIGVVIGMLPGTGSDIASWVSLAVSKRKQKSQCDEGSKSLHCIADATTSNNAALAGSWVPALVFGIPGDSVTAIVIGVLMMKNVTPGPTIFETQYPLVLSIYLIFLVANLIILPIGFLAIKLSGWLMLLPQKMLMPTIALFCVTGAYACNGGLVDVAIVIAMGLLGFVLDRYRYPLGPVVLGLILGGPLEERLVQSLTAANGSLYGMVDRPLSLTLALVTCGLGIGIMVSILRGTIASSQHNQSKDI